MNKISNEKLIIQSIAKANRNYPIKKQCASGIRDISRGHLNMEIASDWFNIYFKHKMHTFISILS